MQKVSKEPPHDSNGNNNDTLGIETTPNDITSSNNDITNVEGA